MLSKQAGGGEEVGQKPHASHLMLEECVAWPKHGASWVVTMSLFQLTGHWVWCGLTVLEQ